MGDVTRRWAEWLRAEGRAPGTIRLKAYWVTRLAETVDPLTADAQTIANWLGFHDWKPETRKSARSALRDFYAWAVDEQLVAANPTLRLRPIQVPAGVAHPTAEDALEAALAAGTDEERVMLLLGSYAGLRRNEIATLRVSAVQGDKLRVTGKGGRTRVIPLHPRLAHALAAWISQLPRSANGWMFPSPVRRGWHVNPDYIYRHVANLTGSGPHGLRHRFGTRAYQTSHDLRATQELLGHSSVATTQRYVAVGEDAKRAAVMGIA